MTIRALTAAERNAATALWDEAGLTRPWNDPAKDFDRAIDGPTSAVLGALDHSGLTAIVMVGHDGHRGWAYYLAVEQAHQNRGLGRRKMQEAELWLRERDVPKLNLMVRHGNAALGFYRRLGYKDAEVHVLECWL